MKSIISSHNKAVLSDYHQSQTQTSNKECNCRKKDQCPLDGKCLTQNVVYQATVTTQTSSESYVGLATNFKDRYRNHTASFRHESKRNETELSKLHKIFNRNNLKVSYSCTTNMANIIKSHNQKILNENSTTSSEKKCNCRNKNLCPLDGTCLTKNIIYEATVTTTSGNSRTYIGMTENEFKTRYNNHKLSFKDRKRSHDTVLSKYIWNLKDGNIDYKINWRIIKRARAYKGNPSRCNLCLSEKLCILTTGSPSSLF